MVADGDSGIGDEITVQIRLPSGSIFSVQIILGSTTVREFKVLLEQNSNISAGQQQLMYKGQVLQDDQTLEIYGLQAEDTIHIVRRLPAVSTSTSGAANHRIPIARYQEILEQMPRHLSHPPRHFSRRLANILSREQIEELRQRIQIQQAERWRRSRNFREMDQFSLPGNQNVWQHNILEQLELDNWLPHGPHLQHFQEFELQNYQRQIELLSDAHQNSQQLIEELENATHRGHIFDSGPDTPRSD